MFPNEASKFIFTRTYARWIEKEGRRETWEEAVNRYINFIEDAVGDRVPQKVFRKCKQYILNFEVMPSMRALWSAGKAAEATNVAIFNCSFAAIDSVEAFAEALFILMCGCGYGFSVENQYVDKLPVVSVLLGEGSGTFQIPDSREGWADSVKFLIQSLYAGKDLEMDYSLLRPKGAKLKTFGGYSSGPEPLISLHDFIRRIFEQAQGRKLKTIECLDILNKIAEIVVVGGTRRSSQISFSDLDDEEIKVAKNWPFPLHRSMSNNSAIYHSKPGSIKFLEEWVNLAKSKTGERGIYNLEGAKKRCPERRNASKLAGSNPSLRANTKILTDKGIFKIQELENKEFRVSNLHGQFVNATCFLSGYNVELYKIILSNDFSYYATKEHKWPIVENNDIVKKMTCELKSGDMLPIKRIDKLFDGHLGCYEDGFVIGWLYGDGWVTVRKDNDKVQYGFNISKEKQKFNVHKKIAKYLNSITGEDYLGCIRDNGDIEFNVSSLIIHKCFQKFGVKHKSHGLPMAIWEKGSEDFRKGFVDGIFSSDGFVDVGSKRIGINSAFPNMIEDLKELLGFYGIKTAFRFNISRDIIFPNGKSYDKDYYSHHIRISGFKNLRHFKKLFKFSHLKKQLLLDSISYKRKVTFRDEEIGIKSIFKTNIKEDVWDISVNDTTHCFKLSSCITGNCGEINLRNRSFCNLSEVIIRQKDDLDDILEKIESAVWLGAIQSVFTQFPYLSRQWKNNANEERLLGVSLSGQMDNIDLLTKDALVAMKQKAIKVARKASKKLEINMPAAITCVKPAGTVSQLTNCSSGLHARFAKYYIRRYRIASIDPLFKLLRSQNVIMTPENGQREEDWHKAKDGDLGACTIYEKGKRWTEDKVNTWVISFPIKSPRGSVLAEDLTAIQQLDHYKKIQEHWCEHNASCTIYIHNDDEWLEVANWVYQNWKYITGVSFLPYDGGHYEQAPYQKITEKEYNKLVEEFPSIDYTKLSEFEKEDQTTSKNELSCVGDKCDI